MKPNREGLPESSATGPTPWSATSRLPADLVAAKALVFDPAGFVCSQPLPEPESAEYAAHTFTLDDRPTRFRTAKTTPTKAGQFVTVWQRSPSGPIRPFDTEDPVDLFVISTRADQHFGHFVFPRDALAERDVVSRNGSGGKRGFRVYPPWVTTPNRQARSTQIWQAEYFLEIAEGGPADSSRARALYHPSP